MTSFSVPRPHDLLWCDDLVLPAGTSMPTWAHDVLRGIAPAVVRRAPIGPTGLIPVGLRGASREQRLAAFVPQVAIRRVVTPESLVGDLRCQMERGIYDAPAVASLPCMNALRELTPALNAVGALWGPTGGVGYALASGLPVLHVQSDLDVLVRLPSPATGSQRDALAWIARDRACRIDVQIDTGPGGFALREWLQSPTCTLLKTAMGPRLVADPWQTRACDS